MANLNRAATSLHLKRSRISTTIFRIFYSTSFTITILFLLSCVAATPIDTLYQSYRRHRVIDIFIIAGFYAVTALVAGFMYASRLYTTRSMLRDIPKVYMPVDKSDLPGKRVWRLIEDCKSRSAVISYQARPRVRRLERESERARQRIEELLRPEHAKEYLVFEPQWGSIAHRGWSSPANTELAGLNYETVVVELVDLVEARAVSLLPASDVNGQDDEGRPIVDEYAIESLSRPEACGMRSYIDQLVYLEALDDSLLTHTFQSAYERARFSPIPLSDDEFQDLMRIFAELLRNMRTPNFDKLDQPDEWNSLSEDDSSTQSAGREKSDQLRPIETSTPTSDTTSTSSIANSVVHNNIGPPLSQVQSIDTDRSYDTAADMTLSRSRSAVNQADPSWTVPTSRPPFLLSRTPQRRADSSKSSSSSSSQNHHGSRTRNPRLRSTASRNSLASQISRRSIAASIANSAHGSVVRSQWRGAE